MIEHIFASFYQNLYSKERKKQFYGESLSIGPSISYKICLKICIFFYPRNEPFSKKIENKNDAV